MTIQRDSISNFIGGVSQQTDKLMLPNQSKVLLNHLPDVVEGLKRRPPSQYVAKLLNTDISSANPFVQSIFIENEEYIALLDGTTCNIFTTDGTEITNKILEPDALAYLALGGNPARNLSAITLGSTTFIVNKTVKTQMSATKTPEYKKYMALAFVKQGNFSTTYSITINGVEKATYTTPDDDASKIKTTEIAKKLVTELNTNLSANWEVHRVGATISIDNNSEEDFTIECADSNGNTCLFAFYKETSATTDLPTTAPRDFTLKIVQSEKSGADDYYVRFYVDAAANNSTFGVGTWKEWVAPDIEYRIDRTTMPVTLVRRADGSFKLGVVSWANRLAGDDESNPIPDFIGQTIKDINTYKGRLGFITDDKAIYSDSNNIYSFFRKTVQTTLDTDPISVASNSKMISLYHSLPFNETMVLFGETGQFTLKGGDTFTNSTVSMDLITAYQCSKDCKPISLGANGYFVYGNGGYTRVMRLFVADNFAIDAEDITVECPSYIPENVIKMTGSTANHSIALLSANETNALYLYNFYQNGRESLQSAWSKWTFDNCKILNIDFRYHKLYIVMQYTDGVYLEVIDFTPKKKETTLDYLLYLDRKYYVTNGVYDDETDTTSFTLPYDIEDEDTFKVVNNKGFEVRYQIDDDTVTVKGEHTDDLIIGHTFKSVWIPPTIYVRIVQGGAVKVMEGTLMLRDINLAYSESGHFEVVVTPKYTTQITSTFKFTGKITGLPSATLGTTPVESGSFLIPIISKSDEITISVENESYLPSCYLSMEWIGDYVQRGGK